MRFLRERIGEILRQLEPLCYPFEQSAGPWRGKPGHFPITDQVSTDTSGWETTDPGILGAADGAWFGLAAELVLPAEMAGMPVELSVSTGREGEWDATNPQIAAYVRGELSQGLDVNHRNLFLSECAQPREKVPVFLSVYTGETGAVTRWSTRLRAVDTRIQKFYYDLLVPWQCLELMDEESREYEELLAILNKTVNLLDFRKIHSPLFWESLERAEAELSGALEKLPAEAVRVSCIGHTHIDVAWLWTLQVTQEKAARSFATVLKLMERYPDYLFMSSQPQLYQYIKQNQPKLYEKIRQRINEGRWEPEGAMYVEADCNLVSGESLVRQCLYGKKFFSEEFGRDSHILWLPDVFGYSAALPQIMEKSGVDSFMTTKISWNETNQIPFDTFWWEGIDGTRILTHFITTRDYTKNGKQVATNNEFTTEFSTNYNGYIHPSQVKGSWQRYQQKGQNDNVLLSFGYGDGGGGPTAEMLETAARLKKGNFGCPAVRQETAGDFFKRLHQTAVRTEFPVWSGELYLEYHRGTYTSMAENKKANRLGEFALLNAEVWSTLAQRYAGRSYPEAELSKAWEILMRNQFHDILPGSAIAAVYEDSRKEYGILWEITAKIQEQALQALAVQICAAPGGILVFNPNGMIQNEIVEIFPKDIPAGWINPEGVPGTIKAVQAGGEIHPVQITENKSLIFRTNAVPAKGWKTYFPADNSTLSAHSILPADGHVPDAGADFFCSEQETLTPFYHLKWNTKGQITSFYDRRCQRELLKSGKCANVLMTYEDKPHKFDNWNLYEYYTEKQWPVENLVSRQVTEKGPVRMALKLTWDYLNSEITETLYFYPDSPRIDIHTKINWQEDQLLLKALFPLNLNTREATYEIQYGNVRRSTTKNNSWEQARFEVCFQKWFDLGEYDYGVSFLTDSKYGVSVHENEVGLTLLKSGLYPNPMADRGSHSFVYSILPHKGSWQEAGTIEQAYGLNNRLTAVMKHHGRGKLPCVYSDVQIPRNNIIAEVLKRSEDGSAEILRFYECWNRRTRTELIFGQRPVKVCVCDLLEKEQREMEIREGRCWVVFGGFEIVTVKVWYEEE